MSLKERFRLEEIESEKLTTRAFPNKANAEDDLLDSDLAAIKVDANTVDSQEINKKLN